MVGGVADEGAARKGALAHALLALHWSVRAAARDDHVVRALATQPNTETRKKTKKRERGVECGQPVQAPTTASSRWSGTARQARARVRCKGSPWLKRGGNGVWRLGTSVWLWPTQTPSNLQDKFSFGAFFYTFVEKGYQKVKYHPSFCLWCASARALARNAVLSGECEHFDVCVASNTPRLAASHAH
jgi:hypothetical protein